MRHIHPGCKCAAQCPLCACHKSWEWEAYVYKGSSFRPKADIKSGTAGLFHCVHSATGQLSKLYCKHCTGLVSLSTMTFSTFHTGRHLGNNLKWITKTEPKRALGGWILLFNNFHFWPYKDPLTILLWHQTKSSRVCYRPNLHQIPITTVIFMYQKPPKNPELLCTYR